MVWITLVARRTCWQVVGERKQLKFRGAAQAGDRKMRVLLVFESVGQREDMVCPSSQPASGQGLSWSLADSLCCSRCSVISGRWAQRGLRPKLGGGGATRLEGKEKPPENEFGNN